ncbi:MobC family plasmid mobilization relaxosome protein, partial [Bacillus mobilis]
VRLGLAHQARSHHLRGPRVVLGEPGGRRAAVGRQLAAWMRQTCLDEKPARTGKLPSISPALLRQLAGMGNNLNQIARRVNAGGGTGHDRVQIVAALMAIDAGLEQLRHAVLEKGTDDDH